MLIKWGALVVDGRGKIGGQVASKNRAGAYMRNKVTPVNPATAAQNTVRSRMATLSQAWRDLTEAERASWNAAVENFAKTNIFGDLKNPSGFNLYQRLNNNLLAVGAAAIDAAPEVEAVPTEPIVSLVYDVAGMQSAALTLDGAVPAGVACELWATPAVSAGVNFVKSEYRLLQVFAAAAGPGLDFLAAYQARFGNLALGQKFFVRVKFVNVTTGQASTYQSISAFGTSA